MDVWTEQMRPIMFYQCWKDKIIFWQWRLCKQICLWVRMDSCPSTDKKCLNEDEYIERFIDLDEVVLSLKWTWCRRVQYGLHRKMSWYKYQLFVWEYSRRILLSRWRMTCHLEKNERLEDTRRKNSYSGLELAVKWNFPRFQDSW